MPFTPYDQVELARYTPLTFEEILKPAMMQRERHDQVEAALADNAAEVEKIGAILDANPADEALRERYNAYKSRLQAETDALLERGVNPVSVKNMHALRKDYHSQIAPVGVAAQLRGKDREAYNQMLARDPSLEAVDPGTRTLQHYLDNGMQSEPLQSISGRDIYRQVGEMVQGLSRADRATLGSISANPEFRRVLPDLLKIGGNDTLVNQYFQQHRDLGFSPADIENFRKTLANPILRGVLEQAFAANGVSLDGSNTRGLAPEQVRRLIDWGVSGLYGAIGKEEQQLISNKRYDDLAAVERMERQAAMTGSGDPPPPLSKEEDMWPEVSTGIEYEAIPFGKLKEDAKELDKMIDKRVDVVKTSLVSAIKNDMGHTAYAFAKAIEERKKAIMEGIVKEKNGGKPISSSEKPFIEGMVKIKAINEITNSPSEILKLAGFKHELPEEDAKITLDNILKDPKDPHHTKAKALVGAFTREIEIGNMEKRVVNIFDLPLDQKLNDVIRFSVGSSNYQAFDKGVEDKNLEILANVFKNPKDKTARKAYEEAAKNNQLFTFRDNRFEETFDEEGNLIPAANTADKLIHDYFSGNIKQKHSNYMLNDSEKGLSEIAGTMRRIVPAKNGSMPFKKIGDSGRPTEDRVSKEYVQEFFKEDASISVHFRPHVGFVFTSTAKDDEIVLDSLDRVFGVTANEQYKFWTNILAKIDSPFSALDPEEMEVNGVPLTRHNITQIIGRIFSYGMLKNREESGTIPASKSKYN
jgi:hypothetical protein